MYAICRAFPVIDFCAGLFAIYMVIGLGLVSVIKQYPEIGDSITFTFSVIGRIFEFVVFL